MSATPKSQRKTSITFTVKLAVNFTNLRFRKFYPFTISTRMFVNFYINRFCCMYVYVKLNMFTKGVFWWAMEARRVEQALVVTVTESRSGAKWQRSRR